MEAAPILLFLLLLLLLRLLAAENTNSTIPVSSELRPGTNSSVWLSESGVFAFGFYETASGNAVGVFIAGISDKTVVWWTPTNFDPILPANVVLLSLTTNSVQLVQISQGNYHPYYDVATPAEAIAEASMLDNGNFVLFNSGGAVIWQSFDFPTDTLLPGQRLPAGQELVSRASAADFGRGKFRLKMQIDGNLVQYPVETPDTDENSYYASGTFGKGNNLSLNLESDGRLHLYNGVVSYNITAGGGRNFLEGSIYVARVDPDGIFRLYGRPLDREELNWTVRWSSTEDKCVPKGICGANSFCTREGEAVTCTCLPGFGAGAGPGTCTEHVDADGCRNESSGVRYEVQELQQLAWDDNTSDMVFSGIEQECGRWCLDDCDCIVALFKDGTCQKQALPMRYGRRSSTNDSYTTLVRVSLPPSPAPSLKDPNASGIKLRHQKRLHVLYMRVIIGVAVGIAILAASSINIYYCIIESGLCGRDEENKQIIDKFVLNHGSLALKRYSYKEVRRITKSFAEKLGHGGYGIVYQGKLPDGELVAVKVLKETRDNAQDFVNEVASISRTSHVNIVNLLGFCIEGKKRALIYEFMPNKSLDKYIYTRGSVDTECSLDWNKLYKIAVGVARGLEYLHRGCNTRIVHFDIKPQNILLDEDFCPKISDFGLAKLCTKKQSVISMLGARGTIGYIAPEVFSRNFGLVSPKSDVYSYGIMLLQMAEARTNVEINSVRSTGEYFLEKVYKQVLVQGEKVYNEISEEEEEAVRKMLVVGFWCIQTAPSERPSMNRVVEMLEGNLQLIEVPPLPFLLSSPKLEFSHSLHVIVETQSLSED